MAKNNNNKSGKYFQVYGTNNCLPVLNNSSYNIINIFIAEDKVSKYKNIASNKNHNKKICYLNKSVFHEKFPGFRTQGLVVTFNGDIVKNINENNFNKKNSCLLILDQVEDPQNAGQIIRTSECAGIDGIIFPVHNSFRITNSVLNVSQGAFVNVPLYEVINISKTLQNLKDNDFWIIGIENTKNAELWSNVDYSGKTAIIVGNEGKGIRKNIINHCDFLGKIPMQGSINSLNVSAAVSAILFERLRQIR